MPTLLETQRAMRAALCSAQLASAAVEAPFDPLLLAIYRNTCVQSLVRALRLSYPAVQRLVGNECFEALAHDFVRTQPSTQACLNDYGTGFAQFLSRHDVIHAVPYLAEVAQLEWAVNGALHAEQCAALDLQRLAQLDADELAQLCLVAQPSLSLLALHFPVDHIWRAVIDQDESAMAAVDPCAGAVWLMIERDADGVHVRRLRADAWQFTQQLVCGEPMNAALQASVAASDEQDGSWAEALLADHLARGRFIDVRLQPQGANPCS